MQEHELGKAAGKIGWLLNVRADHSALLMPGPSVNLAGEFGDSGHEVAPYRSFGRVAAMVDVT